MAYNVPDILYSKIRIKRSLISGETPNSLELGELAANVPDKKLWIGDETNNPVEFVLSGSSGPGSGQTYSEGVGISISSGNVISIDLSDNQIPSKSMNTRILNPPNNSSGVLYWSQESDLWQIRNIEEYTGSDTIDVINNEISVKDQSIGLQHLAEPPNPFQQENLIIKWQSGGWFYGIDQSGGSGGGGGITFSDLFSCIGGVYGNQWYIDGGNSSNNFCNTSASGSDTGSVYTEGFGIDISTDNEISVDVSQLGIGESFSPGFGIDISTDNEISVDVNQLGITEYTGVGDVIISTDNEISVEFTSLSTHLIPDTNITWDLGTAEYKWRHLYLDSGTIYLGDATIKSEENTILVQNLKTQDLTLSNEQSTGNSIDGSTGNWTIQEGENDLFLINNKNGKTYKFTLTEIL